MGHHRRADDAHGEQQTGASPEVGDQAGQRGMSRWADLQRLIEKPDEDDPQQPGDRQLEAPVAARLELEQGERDHRREQAGGEQGHAEEQVQAEGGADELGDVGGHRHELGLDPQAPGHRPGKALTAELGQAVVGGDAELGR